MEDQKKNSTMYQTITESVLVATAQANEGGGGMKNVIINGKRRAMRAGNKYIWGRNIDGSGGSCWLYISQGFYGQQPRPL